MQKMHTPSNVTTSTRFQLCAFSSSEMSSLLPVDGQEAYVCGVGRGLGPRGQRGGDAPPKAGCSLRHRAGTRVWKGGQQPRRGIRRGRTRCSRPHLFFDALASCPSRARPVHRVHASQHTHRCPAAAPHVRTRGNRVSTPHVQAVVGVAPAAGRHRARRSKTRAQKHARTPRGSTRSLARQRASSGAHLQHRERHEDSHHAPARLIVCLMGAPPPARHGLAKFVVWTFCASSRT